MATIRNSPKFLSLIVILLAGLLSSCGGGGSSSSGSNALGASPSSSAVSAVIGSTGGSLTSSDGNATLTVPAGALAADTKITMTEISGSDIPAELRDPSVQKVYDMQPDGLQFAVPATMEVHTIGSSAPPDGTPFTGLISDSHGTLEELGPGSQTVDSSGVTTSAPINHFSDVAMLEYDQFTMILTASPNSVPVGSEFTVTLEVKEPKDYGANLSFEPHKEDKKPYKSDPEITRFGSRRDTNNKLIAVDDVVSLPTDFDPPVFTLNPIDTKDIKRSVTGTCLKANASSLIQVDVDVVASYENIPLPAPALVKPHYPWHEGLEVLVDCTGSSPTQPTVATGLHANPGGLTKSEQAVFLGKSFANLTGGALAAFAGSEGYVVSDLVTGEVKRSKTTAAPIFGAGPISQDPPGPNSSASFFPYGSKSFLDNYYTSDGDFSNFVLTFPPNVSITDVSNAGGSLTSDEQVYVDNFGVHFISYDATAGSYQPASELIDASNFFSMQVAASEMSAGGQVLVVTRNLSGNGALYSASHDGSSVTYIGEVGPDVRGIACKLFVCAVPSFAGDELTIVLWDGINPPTIIGNVPVGDGPVDVDLKVLDSDHVLVGSPGFNDNTSTFTVIASDGSTVSNTTQPVDDGCIHPGHVTFIDDQELLITCYDSNNYDIQDTKAFETVP